MASTTDNNATTTSITTTTNTTTTIATRSVPEEEKTSTFLLDNTIKDEDNDDAGANVSNMESASQLFVNQGLELWERTREEWLAHNSHRNGNDTDSTTRAVAVPVEVDDIIDVIFAPRWRGVVTPDEEAGPPKRFPQNVPLPQMVDILQDLWEAEGLDV